MRNKKALFFVTFLMLLNGCAQNTALLGPAITVATTGNVYQAGITYGTNEAFKKETGKDAFNYVSELVELNDSKARVVKKNKIDEDFIALVEASIKNTREKLLIKN
tara:strand:- start:77 stop:394 length:318 start_codon:yes stop_codon:yes gene_type:complete